MAMLNPPHPGGNREAAMLGALGPICDAGCRGIGCDSASPL